MHNEYHIMYISGRNKRAENVCEILTKKQSNDSIYFNLLYMEVYGMISYKNDSYEQMLGNITVETMVNAAKCVSQCTGCMCNCKCACSGGIIADVEWEEM